MAEAGKIAEHTSINTPPIPGYIASIGNSEIAPSKLRTVLEQEGCKFLPKQRTAMVPLVAQDQLLRLFGSKESSDGSSGVMAVQELYRFLEGSVIQDGRGSDHNARRAWLKNLELTQGPALVKAYDRTNQIRYGNLYGVAGAMVAVSGLLQDQGQHIMGEELWETYLKLGKSIEPAYEGMSEDQKIKAVRNFEDEIILVLKSLAGPVEAYKTMIIT